MKLFFTFTVINILALSRADPVLVANWGHDQALCGVVAGPTLLGAGHATSVTNANGRLVTCSGEWIENGIFPIPDTAVKLTINCGDSYGPLVITPAGRFHFHCGDGLKPDTPGIPNCGVAHLNWVGDGWCDYGLYNTQECKWDGGDCCEQTCVDDDWSWPCGIAGYECLQPGKHF
jgi:hypothetical protein